MKPILKQVTVTGADDSVMPEQLIEIQSRFPFVEWGILLSQTSEGTHRFPSSSWLTHLALLKRTTVLKLSLSAHLCGRWVRKACQGEWEFTERRIELQGVFDRIQFNFHAKLHAMDLLEFVPSLQHPFARGRQIIFQLDDVNNGLLQEAKLEGVNAVGLFDLSGGIGVLPPRWPKAYGEYMGYAGGLSPENLAEQLDKIAAVCGKGPIWIDAETHLRSNSGQQFDLGRVVQFLEIAEPWVVPAT